MQFKLTVKNVSDWTVEMTLTDREDRDYPGSRKFVVTGTDGTPLWMSGGFVFLVASGVSLAPGEEIEFTDTWEQVDYLSNDVPSGVYMVYGVFEFTAGFSRSTTDDDNFLGDRNLLHRTDHDISRLVTVGIDAVDIGWLGRQFITADETLVTDDCTGWWYRYCHSTDSNIEDNNGRFTRCQYTCAGER